MNEDAIAFGLDQQEIPEDWNFSFITIRPNVLQTLRSKIQAIVPPNRVPYNHLSSVWYIDFGATSQIGVHRSMFEEYTKVEQTSDVWTGARPIKAIGTGTVRITFVCSNDAKTAISLKEVLLILGFLTNLVSVSRLREKEVYLCSDNFTLWMTRTKAEIRICKLVGSLFLLQTNEAQDFAMVTKSVQKTGQKPTWDLLHARLDHLSIKRIKKLSKMTTGFKIPSDHPSFFCEPCVLAKQVRHVQCGQHFVQSIQNFETD